MPEAVPIYLDYNATTPVLPQVFEAMLPYLREHFGNPSSDHHYGRKAKEAVEHARTRVSTMLGCAPEEVLFTSGGTEANNLAIRGVAEARADRNRLVTTIIEHPATANPCGWLEQHGYCVKRVGVDAEGRARLDLFQDALDTSTSLATVMHANNETGVLQPVRAIAEMAHAMGAYVHTDAAQSIGKVPVNVDELRVDLLSIAGHKLYAPKGVGALYVRHGTRLEPFARGAGHERGLRPGTENVAFIVGLGKACEVVSADLGEAANAMRELRNELWAHLHAGIPGIALNGHELERLPNTLSVRFPGVSGNAVLAGAPELAASTGSACHGGEEAPPSVIMAMGINATEALGTVRLSLGRTTTRDEVECAARALVRSWKQVATEREALG